MQEGRRTGAAAARHGTVAGRRTERHSSATGCCLMARRGLLGLGPFLLLAGLFGDAFARSGEVNQSFGCGDGARPLAVVNHLPA